MSCIIHTSEISNRWKGHINGIRDERSVISPITNVLFYTWEQLIQFYYNYNLFRDHDARISQMKLISIFVLLSWRAYLNRMISTKFHSRFSNYVSYLNYFLRNRYLSTCKELKTKSNKSETKLTIMLCYTWKYLSQVQLIVRSFVTHLKLVRSKR